MNCLNMTTCIKASFLYWFAFATFLAFKRGLSRMFDYGNASILFLLVIFGVLWFSLQLTKEGGRWRQGIYMAAILPICFTAISFILFAFKIAVILISKF